MTYNQFAKTWKKQLNYYYHKDNTIEFHYSNQNTVKISINKIEEHKFIEFEVVSKDEHGNDVVSQFVIPNSILKQLMKFGKEEK